MRKVLITGPESSGKTTLARKLCEHTGAVLREEYAREYLQQIDRPYTEEDLLAIAREQKRRELMRERQGGELMICDTSFVVIAIWMEDKFDNVHPWIRRELSRLSYDVILLCTPDIPWTPDPLREDPGRREALFESYKAWLNRYNQAYTLIKGNRTERLSIALTAIQQIAD